MPPTTAPSLANAPWLTPLIGRQAMTNEERRRRNRESKQRSRAGTAMSRTEALAIGRRLRLLRRPYVSKLAPGNGSQPRGPGGRFRVGAATGRGTKKEST